MAKISEYGNYETGKSPTETENFKETGVIPVSGSYTGSNNDMETKNVPMSELLGGGSELPDTSGKQGKVLTVNSSEVAVWGDLPHIVNTVNLGLGLTGGGSGSVDIAIDTTDATDGQVLTCNVDGNTKTLSWEDPEAVEISSYNGEFSVVNTTNDVSSGGYMFEVNHDDTLDETEENHQRLLTVANPLPSAEDANVNDVLTKTSDGIAWTAPQGGGGGGSDPFSDIGEWDDGKNPPTKVKDYDDFPLENKGFYISVKKDNDIIKHRFFFQYGGSGSNFYGPWAS